MASYRLIVKNKQPIKYLPDHERNSDGAKVGFNYAWHDTVKREKNLIIEAPRPTVHMIRAVAENSDQPAGRQPADIRLPEMMEAILSNMEYNQQRYNQDRQRSPSNKSKGKA